MLLLAVLAPLAWSTVSRHVYTATALLRVDREEPRVLKFDQVLREDGESSQTQLQTFQRLLQSRTLANRVIELLGLEHHPEFHSYSASRGEVTSAFLDRLHVDALRNARLVKVSFWSHYPDLSAAVANALVDAFMSPTRDQKVEASRYATSFLSKQQEDARRKLETAEAQLADFLKHNDIQFVGADKNREPQALISQQLVILSDALLKARAERIAKESVLNQAPGAEKGAIPAVLQSPVIAKLKEEAAALERKYRELGQAFKSGLSAHAAAGREHRRGPHPAAGGDTEDRRRASRPSTRPPFRTRSQLRKLVDEQRSLARQLEGQMVRFNLLRREAETGREVYTALSSRLKETQIVALAPHVEHLDRRPRGGAAQGGGAADGDEAAPRRHGRRVRGRRARLLPGASRHEHP